MSLPSEANPAVDPPLEPSHAEMTDLSPAAEPELSAAAVAASGPFVGRWNELVSTTNWAKGRLIAEWRDALCKSGAHVTEYSDEAWARLVSGVTSQHVGRLRRAHERFGEVREQYPGLYWSHFQAALDWDDAEMWLEGAIGNAWSVSRMRAARWETHGGAPDDGAATRVVEAQLDEDSYHALSGPPPEAKPREADGGDRPSFGDTPEADEQDAPFDAPVDAVEPAADRAPRVRPFADVAKLPDDVAEAFEQFKLVILTHKLTGWDAISRDDLVGALEALKALALAPSEA